MLPPPPCCSPNNGAVLTLLTGLVNTLYDSYCNLEDPRQYPIDVDPSCEYDFVIVSGSDAACVLASRLTEHPEWSVLVLEAGGAPSAASSVPGLNNAVLSSCDAKKIQGEKTPGLCEAFKDGKCTIHTSQVLGGDSVVSKNLYLRGSKADYTEWAQLTSCDEWQYENVLPYFKKSENYKLANEYHGVGGYLNITKITDTPDKTHAKIRDGFELLGYPYSEDLNSECKIGFSFSDIMSENVALSFLTSARYRENFYISYKSQVIKLLYDESCNRIYGVQYLKNGIVKTVRARKEVIVASDTFSAPQLFMISGFGPRQVLEQFDIPIVKEMNELGQNLRSHVETLLLGYYVTDKDIQTPVANNNEIFDLLTSKSGTLASVLGRDAISMISTEGTIDPNVMLDFYLLGKAGNDLSRLVDKFQVNDDFNAYFKDINNREIGGGIGIHLTDLKSNCKGSVVLRSKNIDDNPIVNSNLYCSEKDMAVVLKVGILVKQLLQTQPMKDLGLQFISLIPGLGNITDDEPYLRLAAKYLSRPIEQTGTCAMGKIVDCDFKVYNVDGIRVVGSSVTPVNIAGNNNIANIMMAEKLAEKIVNGH